MLTDSILSTKWLITTALSNNKVDQFTVTAVDLAKFITKKRRREVRRKRAEKDNSPTKPAKPMEIWLFDLAAEKCTEYVERYKMENADIVNINIKTLS